MTNQERITIAKDAFKKKYADKEKTPAEMGITAAYQRAHLYTPGGNNKDIRREWALELNRISKKYRKAQTEETFIEDVKELTKHMNKCFPQRFNNGKDGYAEEFRIAHAQKSLSVCLKHMWIWDKPNFAIPPVCPIDGVMLKHVGNYDAWTKVNSLKDSIDSEGKKQSGYFSHMKLMKEKAAESGFETTSEWEVVVWYEHTSQGASNNTHSTNKVEEGIFSVAKDDKELNKSQSHYPLEGYRFHHRNDVLYLYVGKYNKKKQVFCSVRLKNKSDILEEKLSFLTGKGLSPKTQYYIHKFNTDELPKAKALVESLKEPIARAIWGIEADKYLNTDNS